MRIIEKGRHGGLPNIITASPTPPDPQNKSNIHIDKISQMGKQIVPIINIVINDV